MDAPDRISGDQHFGVGACAELPASLESNSAEFAEVVYLTVEDDCDPPVGDCMGWRAAEVRSMIERRRWPRPILSWTNRPSSSGPR